MYLNCSKNLADPAESDIEAVNEIKSLLQDIDKTTDLFEESRRLTEDIIGEFDAEEYNKNKLKNKKYLSIYSKTVSPKKLIN